MRSLVIGASGLVGRALMHVLGSNATGTYRSRQERGLIQLDATDDGRVREILSRVRPEVVYFPAAEANVDWCEAHAAEARRLNLVPLQVLLSVAKCPIVGFSSDYVFDGRGGPYREGDRPAPLSAYGRIKVALENELLRQGHTVVRTTTVFGEETDPPKNFVLRLIASMRSGVRVPVASDQYSTPTYAPDLACAVVRLGTDGGIWHVAGPDVLSRAEFAAQVAAVFQLPATLLAATPTSQLDQRARRPAFGGLRSDRFSSSFGPPVRTVGAALADLRRRLTGDA